MKEKINYTRTLTYTIIYLAFFALGLVAGMLFQQSITQATMIGVAGSLEGVQVDVNFNETMMIDAMMDNFEEMGLFNYTNTTNDALHEKPEVKE